MDIYADWLCLTQILAWVKMEDVKVHSKLNRFPSRLLPEQGFPIYALVPNAALWKTAFTNLYLRVLPNMQQTNQKFWAHYLSGVLHSWYAGGMKA